MTAGRGKTFEERIGAMLRHVAENHPTLVEVRAQPDIALLSGSIKRPDFELIYRVEQEHRELIEVQSRDQSSADLAAKIRVIKSLSSRNRFVFVFEDIHRLSPTHRRELEQDGVQCLSPAEFDQKLNQLDAVLEALKRSVFGHDGPAILKPKTGFAQLIRGLLKSAQKDHRPPPFRGPS